MMMQKLTMARQSHHLLLTRLDGLSPLSVLARGYAITTNQAGNIIHSVSQVSEQENLTLRLADGSLQVSVESRITDYTP